VVSFRGSSPSWGDADQSTIRIVGYHPECTIRTFFDIPHSLVLIEKQPLFAHHFVAIKNKPAYMFTRKCCHDQIVLLSDPPS
jgi:hypothetical protein